MTLNGPQLARWLRRGLDRASIYLPVFLMGLLALGTYWLVRTTPAYVPPEPERPARHEPDYFMRGFSVKNFDASGRLQSEITGTEARHYPDNDTLEIDGVRMRAYNPEGHVTVATARRALSNSDGSEVQLFGNAVVVREPIVDARGRAQPRMEFRGEFMHAYTNTEQVKSHLPVVLTRGADQFTGDAMEFDNIERTLVLRGRVRGTMVPKPAGAASAPARAAAASRSRP